MKIKIISAVILTIGFIVISNSCKNNDCAKDGTCQTKYYRFTLGEAREYLWAKPGSYWIYKNTKTGVLDTQICIGNRLDTFVSKGTWENTKYVTIEYERLFFNVQSSFNKWVYVQSTVAPSANAQDPSINRIILRREVWGQGYIECFFYPFELGIQIGNGSYICSYIGMDSTLIVQGKTYFNVAKFDIDFDSIDEIDCQYIPVTTYYWAKGVGLIKKTVNNCNYSWELIDYDIIK